MSNLDRTVGPDIRQLPVMPLPALDIIDLPNGCKLKVLNSGSQDVSRLAVVWRYGFLESDSVETLDDMNALMTEGTETMSSAQLADAFEFNGAWVKSESGRHFTMVSAYALNHTVERIWPLVADMIVHPSFPEASRQTIAEKLGSAERLSAMKVQTKANQLCKEMLFGRDSRMARVKTPEAFRAVTRGEILAQHQRIMRSMPFTIYLAGRIDAVLIERAKEFAASIAPADYVPEDLMISRIRMPERSLTEWRDDPQSLQTAVRISIPVIERTHPDSNLLRWGIYALGGHFGSRLMSNIREEKGYTYGINAILAHRHEGEYVKISCDCDNRFTGDVLKEIDGEIRRLADDPIGLEELEIVRSSAMSNILEVLDSPFSIMDLYMTYDWSGIDASTYVERQRSLQTATPQEVTRALREHFINAPRLIALAGRQDQSSAE